MFIRHSQIVVRCLEPHFQSLLRGDGIQPLEVGECLPWHTFNVVTGKHRKHHAARHDQTCVLDTEGVHDFKPLRDIRYGKCPR